MATTKKTAKDLEELESQFSEIDSKYDSSNESSKIDSDLSLTRLNDVNIDDDEISKVAKDSLQEYYSTNVNKINTDSNSEKQNLESSKETKTSSAGDLKNTIEQTYAGVKEDASNDALKRGLARSSIIINKLEAFDNSKINEINEIDKKLTEDIDAINFQIDALETQKESALNEFNITYASKLNTKISELKDDLTEKQKEVTKYNNEIAQIEADYEKEKAKFNNDANSDDFSKSMEINEFIAKYGLPTLSALKNNEKYESALSYFNTLDKATALSLIQNNASLKTQLGNYYNQLVSQFK